MDERGGELFAGAAARAVELMAAGYAAERRPEERLRQCFLAALHEHEDVEATRPALGATDELHPELPGWPNVAGSPLGGFDLAVQLDGDSFWRYFGEFKWDAPWMGLWDAFKLAHVARLPGVVGAVLIAIATEREWEAGAAGTELFDDHTISSRELLERHARRWQALLRGSAKSRPRTLPRALICAPIADLPLDTIYGRSRLRVASIAPTDAEWIGMDAEGWPLPIQEPEIIEWPYPEPGPGMVAPEGEEFVWPAPEAPQISDEELTVDLVPDPEADWSRIEWFAVSFNGYEQFGGIGNLAPLANLTADYFRRIGEVPPVDLRALRGCLFFEHRRHHHLGHIPSAETTRYIRALLRAIADAVSGERSPGGDVDLFAREPLNIRSPGDLSSLIHSVDDWRLLAPPQGGDDQWKDGRSAKELAKAFFAHRVPAVPGELTTLLCSHEETRGFIAASAVPERLTYFADGSHGPRHHDLALYGDADGRRTIVGIEAKADEGLDQPVGDRLRKALARRAAGKSTVFPERIERFARALFGSRAFDKDGNLDPQFETIPYQLFSGVAGTIREAALANAAQAVFVVFVLDSGALDSKRLETNKQGLEQFCALLGLETEGLRLRRLVGPADYPGSDELPALPLLIGLTSRPC